MCRYLHLFLKGLLKVSVPFISPASVGLLGGAVVSEATG
jgi:hypothetical protein